MVCGRRKSKILILGRALAALAVWLVAGAMSSAPAPRAAGKAPAKDPAAAPLNPVWAVVKEDACPTNQTTDLGGFSPLLCHKGLGAHEFGTTCLYIVTYKGDKSEQARRDFGCTEACPGPDWQVDNSCDSKPELKNFKGKVYFRNFDGLPEASRQQMNQDMATLVALVQADDAKNTATYQKLGGDDKRKAVKQEMVKIALEQMIPFAWATRDASDDVNWIYKNDYSGPVPPDQKGAVNPFEWFGTSNFDIHESAFYIRQSSGELKTEDPNMLAAALLHEFLIHSRQYNRGNAEAAAQANTNLMVTENTLSEIVAYTVSIQDPFYQAVLTASQRKAIGDDQLAQFQAKFKETWPQLDQPSKEQAASWAFYCSDYMKSQLTRTSSLAALALLGYQGVVSSPWTEVCSAVKQGTGVCRLATKKPESPSCLTKHYF
jgi:hypothetical protein